MEGTSFIDYVNDWKADLVKDLPHLNHVNPLVINEQALSVYIVVLKSVVLKKKGSTDEESLVNLSRFVAGTPSPTYHHLSLSPRIWLACNVQCNCNVCSNQFDHHSIS